MQHSRYLGVLYPLQLQSAETVHQYNVNQRNQCIMMRKEQPQSRLVW